MCWPSDKRLNSPYSPLASRFKKQSGILWRDSDFGTNRTADQPSKMRVDKEFNLPKHSCYFSCAIWTSSWGPQQRMSSSSKLATSRILVQRRLNTLSLDKQLLRQDLGSVTSSPFKKIMTKWTSNRPTNQPTVLSRKALLVKTAVGIEFYTSRSRSILFRWNCFANF